MPELSITEAAAQLGVSSDTVRRRIRRGQLHARLDARGHYRIELEAVETAPAGGQDTALLRLELELLRHQRDGLEEDLQQARRAQERDAEERAELRRLLSQALRMLPAGPETPEERPTAAPKRRRWWPWGRRG